MNCGSAMLHMIPISQKVLVTEHLGSATSAKIISCWYNEEFETWLHQYGCIQCISSTCQHHVPIECVCVCVFSNEILQENPIETISSIVDNHDCIMESAVSSIKIYEKSVILRNKGQIITLLKLRGREEVPATATIWSIDTKENKVS